SGVGLELKIYQPTPCAPSGSALASVDRIRHPTINFLPSEAGEVDRPKDEPEGARAIVLSGNPSNIVQPPPPPPPFGHLPRAVRAGEETEAWHRGPHFRKLRIRETAHDAACLRREIMKHSKLAVALMAGTAMLAQPAAAKVEKFEVVRIESPAFEGR